MTLAALGLAIKMPPLPFCDYAIGSFTNNISENSDTDNITIQCHIP